MMTALQDAGRMMSIWYNVTNPHVEPASQGRLCHIPTAFAMNLRLHGIAHPRERGTDYDIVSLEGSRDDIPAAAGLLPTRGDPSLLDHGCHFLDNPSTRDTMRVLMENVCH
ncbi:MAG: hypothetical protein IT319_07970 [Anaerolineae bacterium]|nr:hypothetical protein [Anaerolineae bacterium]